MHKVIDTPWNTTPHLAALRAGGVETIIRYYNHERSKKLPEKRVEESEARAIADEGMSLAVVFQQRGGNDGHISDLDAKKGARDAHRALELADRIGQPDGSAIYFAVDHDYYKASHLASIEAYFEAVRDAIDGKFRVGVYGSGTVSARVRDAGFASLIWLAAAKGWSGTKAMLKTTDWALFQIWPQFSSPLKHDGNVVSTAWADYGQFTPGGSAAIPSSDASRRVNTSLMQVTARGGLNLRRGAGTQFAVERTLAFDTIVHALGRQGDWILVDVEGDGVADGHMHGDFLHTLSGGLPLTTHGLIPPTPPTPPTPLSAAFGVTVGDPYAIANAELALDVREVPGLGNNPRIVMYHNTTNPWSGTDDSVPWCSSFVNYCVEQAGMTGTDSQRALDWEAWGVDVTGTPEEGDIAVFKRGSKGGHVGFFVKDLGGGSISVLGGNQSNRVKLSTYPKDGKLGSTQYKLRSIRRG